MRDTIYALATAPGRAAIAVVRISGPEADRALHALTDSRPRPRRATLALLRRPASGDMLDQALVLRFPSPASYTGEDQVELHLHGGPAIVSAVAAALAGLGLRAAEPGEFTRRAFESGRMDLSEAEAVADLVEAETDSQHRQALAQLQGRLARRQEAWRSELLDAAAVLEAAIDFPDEDLPQGLMDQARQPLERLRADLVAAAADRRGESVRDGFRIALVGAPNAGKSSLLNALAGRDAAIVTEIAGTTRDVIEVPLVIEGYKVILADMAGLRPTPDRIEQEGVARARAWSAAADLRLLVADRSASEAGWRGAADALRPGDVLVLNKADRAPGPADAQLRAWAGATGLGTVDCAATEPPPAAVQAMLKERVVSALSGGEPPAVTRERHRLLLAQAVQHLDRALAQRRSAELMAEDIRLAARAMERLSGRIDPESILDQVFGAFCIGK